MTLVLVGGFSGGRIFLCDSATVALTQDLHAVDCKTAIAAIAAVSVRRMRGPKPAALNPAISACSYSASLKPPSGPTSSVTTPCGVDMEPSGALASGLSKILGSALARLSPNQFRNGCGASITGRIFRPHCSQALMTTFDQCCARFFRSFSDRVSRQKTPSVPE